MKKILFTVLSFILISNSYSQIVNDTLPDKKHILNHWGFGFDLGFLSNQLLNQNYISKLKNVDVNYALYYKNFFINCDVTACNFSPKQTMTLGNIIVDNTTKIESTNLSLAIGYIYNFYKNWSAEFKLGLNDCMFEVLNYGGQQNVNYDAPMITGAQIGIGIDRYFTIKRYHFIVLKLKGDYYTTNYKIVSPDLNHSSLSYSLSIGYKFFLKKRIVNSNK